MALSLTLPVGVVAVYGDGTTTSGSGVIAPPGYSFGVVSKIYDGGAVFVYNGDNVMFREADVMERLVEGSGHYTLLPARLVTLEILPP